MNNYQNHKLISIFSDSKFFESINLRQLVFDALASVPKDVLLIFSFLRKKEKKQKKKPFALVEAQVFTIEKAFFKFANSR